MHRQNLKANNIGLVGFTLAIVSLFLGWFPIVGWLILFLGFIFSLIGVFRKPRIFAIIGLICSIITFTGIFIALYFWYDILLEAYNVIYELKLFHYFYI